MCEDVLCCWTTPNVQPRHVARIKVKHGGDIGMSVFELLEKTPDRRIRAGIAAGAHQRPVDRRATETLTASGRDLALAG